jgi:hypothetical protein
MFRAIVDVGPDDAKDLKRFATFLNILWLNLNFF